jgi:hypothetical protein
MQLRGNSQGTGTEHRPGRTGVVRIARMYPLHSSPSTQPPVPPQAQHTTPHAHRPAAHSVGNRQPVRTTSLAIKGTVVAPKETCPLASQTPGRRSSCSNGAPVAQSTNSPPPHPFYCVHTVPLAGVASYFRPLPPLSLSSCGPPLLPFVSSPSSRHRLPSTTRPGRASSTATDCLSHY